MNIRSVSNHLALYADNPALDSVDGVHISS